MEIEDPPSNVTQLPIKTRKKPGQTVLHVAAHGDCRHLRVRVDPDAANLQCRDCGQFINPIAYLVALAKHESRYQQRLSILTANVALAEKRLSTKCEHCGKQTRVNVKATTMQIHEAAERIEREE